MQGHLCLLAFVARKDLLDLKQILTVGFRTLLSLRGRRLKGEGKGIPGAREPRRLQSA